MAVRRARQPVNPAQAAARVQSSYDADRDAGQTTTVVNTHRSLPWVRLPVEFPAAEPPSVLTSAPGASVVKGGEPRLGEAGTCGSLSPGGLLRSLSPPAAPQGGVPQVPADRPSPTASGAPPTLAAEPQLQLVTPPHLTNTCPVPLKCRALGYVAGERGHSACSCTQRAHGLTET